MTTHTCKCGRPIPSPRNSTIWSKECPSCALKSAMKKKGEITRFPKIKAPKEKKRLLSDKSTLMKKADEIFSRYIRLKHSLVSNGEVFCRDIITGNLYSIKKMDNGHFISRGNFSTRYHEDNCRPQNRSSNRFRGEMDKDTFQRNLINEIGWPAFERLMQSKYQPGQDFSSSAYFLHIIEEYTRKYKELLIQYEIKDPWK